MKLLGPPASASRRRDGKAQVSRPITDRVKESLFSVLYKYGLPKGKMVADLFSGVGSLGLEALSRGAVFVTFVEQDAKIIAVLERNIEKASFVKQSKVIRANVFKIGPLRPVATRQRGERIAASAPISFDERKYNLIFVDPPYSATGNISDGSLLSGLLDVLSGQLAPKGIVVVRTHRRTFLLEQYGRLKIIERRQWGTMAVTILRMSETH